jgi:hypothetical protein
MGVLDRIKSWLGSKPINAPPERRLSAESQAALSASLRTLVLGANGWITLEEARRLFSLMDEAQYAFGELDGAGRSNLGSFAAQNHCKMIAWFGPEATHDLATSPCPFCCSRLTPRRQLAALSSGLPTRAMRKQRQLAVR